MRGRILLLAAVVMLGGAGRALAHHSFTAEYDSTKKASVEGVVTELVWRNPHSFMRIDVTEPDGTKTSWALEWGSVSQLSKDSITRTTLKPGDRVLVDGSPARDGAARRMLIGSIKRPSDGWEWKGRVQ
jgi:hypothetical protein